MADQTVLARADAWQQRHPAAAFVVGVAMRFREDRGGDFGALLSYYGFISLFPLLAVLVTILGIVLHGNADLRTTILDSVYGRIPVVGTQLRQNTTALDSSGWVLALGLVVSIWSGLRVARHADRAFNLQWGISPFRRASFVGTQLRTLGVLAVIAVGLVAATAATSAAASLSQLPLGGQVVGMILAIAINIAMLTVAFRLLIQASVSWRDVYVGGIVGGIALWALQLVGATYVSHVIVGASDVYGSFAVVFGLLVWIALVARIALLAGPVNVVRARHLWPRSLVEGSTTTAADQRAWELTAQRDLLA